MALSGMALDVMTAVGAPHLPGGCNGGAMLEPLVGLWDGLAVDIIGNGPGRDDWRFQGRPVILCNGGVTVRNLEFLPGKALWLVCEARAHTQPWMFQQHDFGGHILWDAAMFSPIDNPDPLTEEMLLAAYDEEFLLRVIWFLRHGQDKGVTGSGWNTREWRDGLLQYLPITPVEGPQQYEIGEVVGGCGMAAIHLAHLMGAAEIHTWGMPLAWWNMDTQHADGSCPWTAESHPVNRPELAFHNDTALYSTPFHKDCANAIKWFVKEAGMRLIDHSGGLLS